MIHNKASLEDVIIVVFIVQDFKIYGLVTKD